MKSYKQHCALARALDVVGERWSLLIVRELLVRGECRYTDLQSGLPGIATNLLARRLRDLEASGVILRREAGPPVAATLYALTPRGLELKPVLLALGAWGLPAMAGRKKDDVAQQHWYCIPMGERLVDRHPERARAELEVRIGKEPFTIETSHGRSTIRPGCAVSPAATVTGSAETLLAVLSSKRTIDEAIGNGLTIEGSKAAFARVVGLQRRKV